MPLRKIGSAAACRSSEPASSSASGRARLRHVADEPARERRAVAEEEVGLRDASTAVTTSSSSSTRRIAAASTPTSGVAWRTTSSSTAAGSSSVASSDAGAGELLRERPRSPLLLEDEAPLERPARGAGEMLSELEVVVRDAPLVLEEHEHDGDATLPVREPGS